MNASQTDIEKAIINTVSYVDAFDYPLTLAEIHRYLIQHRSTSEDVAGILARGTLVPDQLERSGDYYMLPGRERVVDIRRQRQDVALQLWPEACRYGRIIARMPFVRMVAVTGSLAVNNAGPGEDIDYLIVTADDHLWVCRAFVILVVRWAAKNGLHICPNYFLAERALHIQTQNLYTAHELAQMVPLSGMPVYRSLRKANQWTQEFLPNATGAPSLPGQSKPNYHQAAPRTGSRLAEALLGARPSKGLDHWEMSRKIEKFRHHYQGWEEAEFSPDVCKGHFNFHQHRTIQAYQRLVSNGKYDSPHVDEPGIAEPNIREPL